MIEVRNLGKKYRIGALREPYLSLRDSIARKNSHLWNVIRGKENVVHKQDDFWALKDVSFSVDQGEAVGIIGRNGAGKSTLLKILSQITPPTEGRITLRGRVASLLEVGTGFHPELSGRENIYLNGAILGMTRREIRSKFDEIVAFAEVEKFLDTPVKRYSSGMYVRLAFAVAAHLEPEILVVDEVLAVGDSEFQKRCLGKMSEVSSCGRTVLFVSHNLGAVSALCSKAVLLESGKIEMQGETQSVIMYYSARFRSDSPTAYYNSSPNNLSNITSIGVKDDSYTPKTSFFQNDSIYISITYTINLWPSNAYLTLDVFDDVGRQIIWSCDVAEESNQQPTRESGEYHCSAEIPGGLLRPGRYFVGAAIYSPTDGVQDSKQSAVAFDITDCGSFLARIGICQTPALTAIPVRWVYYTGFSGKE